MHLLDAVRQFIRQHELAGRDTRVVVALSGGSDSVALTHILRELESAGELRVVGLAHFNHQLRRAADEDERFCVRLAESLEWPIAVEREDVAARARRDRRSVETAARAARYAFLERARVRFEADTVALGHTRDDQAETFLLRLMRGAGVRGLAGMHPRNGPFIRPVLTCRRADLRAYLAARQVAHVEDESNADVSIPRNRVRAELIPLLERRFNPQIVDALADEAEMAKDTLQWLETEADTLLDRAGGSGLQVSERGEVPRHGSPRVRSLDVETLNAAPLALRRFALWRAMTDAAGGRPVSFDHVRAALAVAGSIGSSAADVPGHRVERIGSSLVLRSRAAGASGRPPREIPNFFEYPLSIPGEVIVPSGGCVVSAERLAAGALDPRSTSLVGGAAAVAVVRGDFNDGSWRVRSRHPGDRFRPVGVGGRKKLQDFFVDRKVPRQRRDTVPIVVDGADRIVWVAGYGIDETFRVTDPAQAVVVLRLKLLGGPA